MDLSHLEDDISSKASHISCVFSVELSTVHVLQDRYLMPMWAVTAEENLHCELRCSKVRSFWECLFLFTVYEGNLDLDVYGTSI